MSSDAQNYRTSTRNPTTYAPVNATSANQAYTDVMADVGASKHLDCNGNWSSMRDSVDTLDVNDTMNRTGRVINMPSDVGGWPSLAAGTACTDSDHDGMPDAWETAHGLNPNDPSDGSRVDPQSGYTYLEDYLNGINPAGGTVPPVVSNGAPSGTLPAGTVQATMSVSTDKAAICRYATSPGVAYNSMPNTFSTTGGTSHAALLSGLSDGKNYSYSVRCIDQSGNADTTDYPVQFAIGMITIQGAPVVSGGSPAGSLPAGTTTATLTVATDVAATCHYAVVPGMAYASMPYVFTITGGTAHSATLTGLISGANYNEYVRCANSSGTADTADYVVSFSVATAGQQQQPPPAPPLPLSVEAESGTLAGSAVLESCNNCSGKRGVGYMGNYGSNPGSDSMAGFNVASAGTYKLTIYYLNGASTRSAYVGVNGAAGKSVSFPNTGNWSTVNTVTTTVTLKAGANTIQVYNTKGPGPDLDRSVVSP
jgi:hypothetical protein